MNRPKLLARAILETLGSAPGAVRTALLACLAVAALGGCAASEADEAGNTGGPLVVELVIHHSTFSASEIDVPAGVPVRYVVRNDDPIDHELLIGDARVQARHESGKHAQHGDVPGEVTVPATETATTTFTAPADSEPLYFGCHLPGHWDYGMRGTINRT